MTADLTIHTSITGEERRDLSQAGRCAGCDDAAVVAVYLPLSGHEGYVEGYCIKHARRVCGHKAPVQHRGRPVPLDTLIWGES